MTATALWGALLAPVFLWLSGLTIRRRGQARVAVGSGGDAALERAMRAHANFAEYVPFALVLMALAEAGGTPRWIIHVTGGALLAGRALHGWNFVRPREDLRLRITGMIATFCATALAAVAALVASVGGWG